MKLKQIHNIYYVFVLISSLFYFFSSLRRGDQSTVFAHEYFMFEWQEQYLTSERSKRVKYCSCHENIRFISSSLRVMFFLLYKRTDDGVFDDFPKISDHFPKISENFPKLLRRPDERSRTFSENFRRLPKIAEDFMDTAQIRLIFWLSFFGLRPLPWQHLI